MLEPLPTWKQTFKEIPFSDNPSWAMNIARWTSERSTSKLEWAGLGGPLMFTFNSGVFQSRLHSMPHTPNASQGAMAFASAWESAMSASTLMVMPGIFIGGPTPPTLFSVVAGAIDPASIQRGKAVLAQQLLSAKCVDNSMESALPPAIYQAFMALTVSLSGINTVVPFPSPLMAPMVPAC